MVKQQSFTLSGAITAFSLQGKNKVFKLGLRIANAH
jgi:hypothetical protein